MSVLDFLENPALVGEAKKDFEKELGGQSYTMLLPEDLVPGANIKEVPQNLEALLHRRNCKWT